jgi:hypothetical protein
MKSKSPTLAILIATAVALHVGSTKVVPCYFKHHLPLIRNILTYQKQALSCIN